MKPTTYFQDLLLNGGITNAYVATTYETVAIPSSNMEDPPQYEQRWILILRHGDIQYSITQAQAEEEYNYMLSVCDESEKATIIKNYEEVLSCLQ